MKYILLMLVCFNLAFASNQNSSSKNKILKEQMKKNIEQEKKFAKEQKFYQGDEYNLKAHEVNPDSLKTTPELEVDDLDMDDVYN